MPSIETATILITDLVGSTSLAARVGRAVADELRQEHFSLLRDAIDESGGSEVKNTGDGLMVAFRSTTAAVDCAIAMQQRLARRNRSSSEQLHVRIGLGTGEATVEEGDYFGMPSVEAARLCDSASADRIFVSELVTMMAQDASDVFAPLGHLTLKGIPKPVSVFEVLWERSDGAGGLALPTHLPTDYSFNMVGRDAQFEALRAAWQEAAAGAGGVALLSAGPGNGKTRLLAEAARAMQTEGATVLFGRCQDGLGTPFHPLLEAVRHYASVCPPSRLAALRERGAILARLEPDLVSVLPEPASVAVERRSEQRLMSDAMLALLSGATRHGPTVLALDNLHRARPPLLDVVRYLADATESQPLLVILSYRDTEVGTDDPLSDLVVDLRRKPRTKRISLGALGELEVAQLIEQAAAEHSAGDIELARRLTRFTGGNPLLITELLSAVPVANGELAEIVSCEQPWDAAAAGVPESMTKAVHARMSRISSSARHVLEVAAVVGEQFEMSLVAAVAEFAESDCLTALDEALAAGILEAQRGSIRRFTFSSPAVRQAVYMRLTTPDRLRMHRAIAERIESSGSEQLIEVAEHWFAATELAGIGAQHLPRAIEYAERAGRRASENGEFLQAGRQYRHAAQLVEAREAGSRHHGELLLDAGRAYALANAIPKERDAFRGAAEVARRIGDGELLASAALGFGAGPGDAFYVLGPDETLTGLLEQALAGMGADGGPRRIRVLSRLAVELHLTGFVERREALSREAVELARAIADPAAEMVALYGWLVANWSADELAGRLAGSDELIRGTESVEDLEMAYRAHALKLRALLELGDMARVDQELRELDRLANATHKPLQRWHAQSCRTMRALLGGDIEEGGRSIEAALRLGASADPLLAARAAEPQAALRQWIVGPSRELIPILRGAVQSCPWLAVRRARLAFGLAELGRKTEAIAEFEPLAQDDFVGIPRDGNWLMTMAFLSLACAALGDVERAGVLAEALEPYDDRFLVSGDATTAWGPVSTALAALAMTVDHYDEAADWFDRALEQCAVIGAEPQRVYVQREYARLLLRRGRSGDRARAVELLDHAAAGCARRGFGGLAEQVASVGASAG